MYGLSFKTPQLSLKAKAIHKFLKMFSPWVKENLCKRNTKAVPRDFMNLKKLTSSLLNKCFEVNLISALIKPSFHCLTVKNREMLKNNNSF